MGDMSFAYEKLRMSAATRSMREIVTRGSEY